MTLDDYRNRYAQYRSDPALRKAHASFPFLVIWDDHEVDNNYAGLHQEAGAPVDSYAVGSYISGATPIDFTGDIKEIDGRPIAKRGRIPGLTPSPRLKPVDLAAWREG